MELRPVPSRRSLMGRLWLFVGLALLAPFVLLVLMPSVLGFQRYVVTTDAVAGSVPRGSLTFAQSLPATDVAVGDVITFRPPRSGSHAAYVTRRVVSVTPVEIRTATDHGLDPWRMTTKGQSELVVAHIPYVGYPFVSGLRPAMWVLLACVPMLAVVLALVADLRRARQRRRVLKLRESERGWVGDETDARR